MWQKNVEIVTNSLCPSVPVTNEKVKVDQKRLSQDLVAFQQHNIPKPVTDKQKNDYLLMWVFLLTKLLWSKKLTNSRNTTTSRLKLPEFGMFRPLLS